MDKYNHERSVYARQPARPTACAEYPQSTTSMRLVISEYAWRLPPRRYDQQYKAYQATEGYKEFVAARPPEERGCKRKAGPEGGGGTPKLFKVRPVQFSHMSAPGVACAAAPSRSRVLAMDARPSAVLMRAR